MTGATSGLIVGGTAVNTDTGAVTTVFGRTGDVLALTGDYAAFYVPYTGASGDVNIGAHNMQAGGYKSSDGSAGITATITTAALTTLGTQGSMTFKNGILTAQVAAT